MSVPALRRAILRLASVFLAVELSCLFQPEYLRSSDTAMAAGLGRRVVNWGATGWPGALPAPRAPNVVIVLAEVVEPALPQGLARASAQPSRSPAHHGNVLRCLVSEDAEPPIDTGADPASSAITVSWVHPPAEVPLHHGMPWSSTSPRHAAAGKRLTQLLRAPPRRGCCRSGIRAIAYG